MVQMPKNPNSLFIDTSFVVALINTTDLDHVRAVRLANKYKQYPLVTTDAILLEIENALSREYIHESLEIIAHFYTSERVMIIHLNSLLLQRGIEMYNVYQPQRWDLVDCLSFVVMHEMGITEALTSDVHFEQANFIALMRT